MMSAESQIKLGVDLRILAPQWAIGYPIVQQAFLSRGYSCVVTNGNERTPEQLVAKPNTLHPSGRALDFRTKHVPMSEKLPLVQALKEALGAQWDVELERVGQEQEHVHVEFDVKEPAPVEA
jgi:hypothetical protein